MTHFASPGVRLDASVCTFCTMLNCRTGIFVISFSVFPRCLCVVELAGPPSSVSVIEISPTTVLLDIQPPLDGGGVEIYGYRIQYLLKIDDFMIGMFTPDFMHVFLCLIIFVAVTLLIALIFNFILFSCKDDLCMI